MVQQMKRECSTGTDNSQYDLISVIYHSLQSAAVCEMYIQDAEQSGDRELTEFFREVKERSCQTAEQAKQLMTKKMGQQ
ncbi:hypothetical protein IQ238_06210 [Pleurocapsales cyanobacterium LEGE 06147]|nr:hypothetical protein [Pleurocapsales cyanobacterium LEGE 06147]